MASNISFHLEKASSGLRGTSSVPGDKSISHRALLLGMLAQGVTQVRGWLAAGDTEATLSAVRALGVPVERHDTHTLSVTGGALREPSAPLDFVNAGTGIRLAAGLLAGQPFASVLDGSEQLRRRPMGRILRPLRAMGAHISGQGDQERAPLHIQPAKLKGTRYDMPIASAQVKSAILLAGLHAEGPTTVIQPGPARDHTENMLRAMGAHLVSEGHTVTLHPGGTLQPLNLTVPGDFSSAAFLLAGASTIPNSALTLNNINLNPTRTGLLDVLRAMGAEVRVLSETLEGGEPMGDLQVQASALRGVSVAGETVVRMIDEFPALMVVALHAEGETVVRDAQELRVKETDRIAVMAAELRKMGADITETEDGFRIIGPQKLRGAIVDAHDDHRVAMSLTLAGLLAEGSTRVDDARCAGDSFPGFAATLQALGAPLEVSA